MPHPCELRLKTGLIKLSKDYTHTISSMLYLYSAIYRHFTAAENVIFVHNSDLNTSVCVFTVQSDLVYPNSLVPANVFGL